MPITVDQVRAFLVESWSLEPSEVTDDAPLFTSGILDSLSAVEIICFVEKHMKATINRAELSLDDLDTINDIFRLAAKLNASAVPELPIMHNQ
jgi:acyl carrier protein/D-alanine--poly(phosphoribitol) ligase subunit 2